MHLIWLKKIFSISKNFPVHHTGKWLVYIYKPSWTLFSCAYTRYTRPTQYPSSLPRIGWPNKPATHIYNLICLLHSNTHTYIYIYIYTHTISKGRSYSCCAQSPKPSWHSQKKKKKKKGWTLFSCAYIRYTWPTQCPSSLPRIGWPNKPPTHSNFFF